MLSKAFRPINKSLYVASKAAFGSNPGILHRVFNTVDTNTHAYRVASFDPLQPFIEKNQKSIETLDRAPEYNVTNLPNGFTVLTES